MPSPATPAPPDITTLDRSLESATDALYRAAIGPINAAYYVPIFARFEAAGRAGPSWNWAASLYTLNWMMFRRLWVAAVLYLGAILGLLLMVFGLGRVLFQWSGAAELAWLAVCGVLGFVLPGVLGNAIFHASSRQQMAAALSASATLAQARRRLSQQASSRPRFLWLVLGNLALAGFAALAYVAWPVTTVPVFSLVPRPVAGDLPQPLTLPAGQAGGRLITPTPIAAAPLALSEAASVPPQGTALVTPQVKIVLQTDRVDPQTAASSALAGERYLINVGLFKNAANARNAYEKLYAAGLPASRQTLKGRTRVRAGPFASDPEAQAAAAQIRAMQLDAVVFQP